MKRVKVCSLVSLAAAYAMALIGPATSSAESNTVVLCKTAELECENPWPNPTTIVGHAVNPKVLSSIGTFECEKSTVEITLLNNLAKLGSGHILTYTLEGICHLGSTNCTVGTKELGGGSGTHGANPLEAIVIPVPLVLIVEGKEVRMNTVVNVKCGFLINCTYTFGEETVATITNSASGEVTLTANKSPLKRSEGFCPNTSEIDATYVGSGTGLYIES